MAREGLEAERGMGMRGGGSHLALRKVSREVVGAVVVLGGLEVQDVANTEGVGQPSLILEAHALKGVKHEDLARVGIDVLELALRSPNRTAGSGSRQKHRTPAHALSPDTRATGAHCSSSQEGAG